MRLAHLSSAARVGRRTRLRAQARMRAEHAVLVEAPAPVGAAVVGAAHAADLGVPRLGGDPGGGVDRVVVGEAAQDLLRVDRPRRG